MKTNSLGKIMKEYQEKKDRAIREAANRKHALEEKFPPLQAAERRIYELNLQIAKATLTANEELLPELNNQLEMKKNEKKKIMRSLDICEEELLPQYECSLCQDTGYLPENDKWVKCSCLINRLMKELYRESGITNRIDKENFGTFEEERFSDIADPKHKVSPRQNILLIKQAALDFIEEFDNINEKNLIFYGGPGLGKTFLCSCIAKELMDRQKTVFYQSSSDFFNLLSEFTFSKEDSDRQELRSIHEFIMNADLLIIDDLGSELTNSFTINMLFNIINHRLMNHKKMILSTNLNTKELHERYGERIASRLVMGFSYYRFFGKDIRWTL